MNLSAICNSMKIIFLIISSLFFVTNFQAQQNSSDCQKPTNSFDEKIDLYAFSFTGLAKEIKILEKNLESDLPQEITRTIKFDDKGKITETYLTNDKIKMFGKTVYFYDAKNRIIKKSTYNPNGSAVSEYILGYDPNDNLESRIIQNAITKKVISKTEYKYESPESYLQFYDGKFARRVKLIKDKQCRVIESSSYKKDKSLENKLTMTYDDKNNIVESIVFSPDGNQIEKTKYEYEYGDNGNWIKQSIHEWTFRDGDAPYHLSKTKQRSITYAKSK